MSPDCMGRDQSVAVRTEDVSHLASELVEACTAILYSEAL
jgi:hypothetical protein